MADFHRQGGTSPELARNQHQQQENFERNVPAMIRDGKDIAVTFDAGTALTISHGLRRVPKGWFIHSAKGTPYAINEVMKDEREIRLINNYGGAGDLEAVLWIW